MTDTPVLEDALALALRLPAKERLKLVEHLVSSVENEMEASANLASTHHWGAELVAALNSGELDTSAWVAMEIDDPVEWVKRLRLEEEEHRRQHWDHEA